MDDRTFEVRCNASHDGQLQVKTHALSVAVSQLVSRGKTREMWQSILVFCEETEDHCLVTKIIVCHPDWDQNLQIACVRSGDNPKSPFEVDLNSVRV
jgi:hypothetical protein